MKYYLSSYRLGNELDKLKKLVQLTSGNFAYIPNALDFTKADPERRKAHVKEDMQNFGKYCSKIELLDLKEYFEKTDELRNKIDSLGGLYISGGNVFVLRQAMKISGLDKIILDSQDRDNFLYSGYSAGVCVLTPNLGSYAIVDNANDFPYSQINKQVWEGLGILNFAFEPHYHSDHPESKSVDKEILHCIDNKILFKAYKDGEVLIIED